MLSPFRQCVRSAGRHTDGVRRAVASTMSKEESFEKSSKLKSAALLELMKAHIASEAGTELRNKIGFVYQLNIAPLKMGINEEIYVVDLKDSKVSKGAYSGKPDATFSFVDNDFLNVATGKMNPQMAFIRGKMRIKGSMRAAQKFTPDIFPKPSKL